MSEKCWYITGVDKDSNTLTHCDRPATWMYITPFGSLPFCNRHARIDVRERERLFRYEKIGE